MKPEQGSLFTFDGYFDFQYELVARYTFCFTINSVVYGNKFLII